MAVTGHAPTCPLVCCTSVDDPAVGHGYEPEPFGSGLCICGRADDHDIHWPPIPAAAPADRPYEEMDEDERRGY